MAEELRKSLHQKISESPYFRDAVQKAIEEKLYGDEVMKKKNTSSTTPMPNLDEITQHALIEGDFLESITTVINQSDKDVQSSVIKVDEVNTSIEQESKQALTGSADLKKVEAKGSTDVGLKRSSKIERNNTTTTNSNTVPAKHVRSLQTKIVSETVKCTISGPASLKIHLQLQNNNWIIYCAAGGIGITLALCAIPLLAAGGAITASTSVIGVLAAKFAGLSLANVSICSGVMTLGGGVTGGAIGYKIGMRTVTLTLKDVLRHLEDYKEENNKVSAVIEVQHDTEVSQEPITPAPPPNSNPGEVIEQEQLRRRRTRSSEE